MQKFGDRIRQSGEIKSNIKNLVSEALKLSEGIQGVRPALPTEVDGFKKSCEEIGSLRGRPLYYNYVGSGAGYGPYVELEDGSIKLDLINGIGIHILGHSHPEVLSASVEAALSDVTLQGNLQPNQEYRLILEKLIEIASRKSSIKYGWLTTCGAMAGENALKIVRQKTKAAKVIAMQNAFAGRSMMMAEITDNPAFKQGLPDYHEILRIPFFDPYAPEESTKKALEMFKEHVQKNKGQISCFSFEPMQGEGGFNVAPRDYFVPMLDICKNEKIPVWFDEVQTFCRTGEFFAFQKMDLGEYVDVITVAKSLQGAATLYTEEMNPQPGLISGTFAGSSVALNVGRRVLDYLDTDQYMGANGKIQKIHEKFIKMLNELNETTCKGLLRDAGGMGLMVSVIPLDGSNESANKVAKTLYTNGIIGFTCGRGPYKLRFLLPAILEDKHIAEAKTIFEKTILECK